MGEIGNIEKATGLRRPAPDGADPLGDVHEQAVFPAAYIPLESLGDIVPGRLRLRAGPVRALLALRTASPIWAEQSESKVCLIVGSLPLCYDISPGDA